jgi:hypothetical protein
VVNLPGSRTKNEEQGTSNREQVTGKGKEDEKEPFGVKVAAFAASERAAFSLQRVNRREEKVQQALALPPVVFGPASLSYTHADMRRNMYCLIIFVG